MLLTFCFEPCLAVVQALSREFFRLASYFLEKVSSKSELGLRPISPADQSYRVHLLVRNSAACGRYGGLHLELDHRGALWDASVPPQDIRPRKQGRDLRGVAL